MSLALPYFLTQPRRRAVTQAALLAGGAGIIALSARLAVPLPFSPVPVTGQTLAVLVLAGLLGRRCAGSVALYLFGAALGLPVLADGLGGLARLAGPTGGYLAGFLLAGYVVGRLADGSGGRWWRLLAAMFAGEVLIYACGLLWLSRFLPAGHLLTAGLYPFLVGDAYKVAVALGVVAQGRRLRSGA